MPFVLWTNVRKGLISVEDVEAIVEPKSAPQKIDFGGHYHRRIQEFFRAGLKDKFIRMCTDYIAVKT